MSTHFDVIVISTGQAGPSLAACWAIEGEKTAIVERKLFGGTCVNTGYTRTETMVASARAAYVARRAAEYGVMIDGPVTVDMSKVISRKDKIIGQSNSGVENWLKSTKKISVYERHARFESH